MTNSSYPPRSRSLPVVLLDTVTRWLTTVRRPFRKGRLPTSQRIAVGIGVGIMTIGAAVLLVGVRWVPSAPVNAPHQAAAGAAPGADRSPTTVTSPSGSPGTPGVASSSGSVRPDPSGSTSGGAAAPAGTSGPAGTGAAPRAEPLQARYGKVAGSETLASYRATVTVVNPGPVAVSGWKVTLTLPRETLTVSNVVGATADRSAATWTLVPTAATTSVPAGGSVSVTFQVNGAAVFDATPTACAVDGRACTGLAD